MTKTEFDKTAAPAELAGAPADLTEGELSQVQGGALPPIRGPKQPADG